MGLGIEEFEGIITCSYFKLKRCKVANKDNIKFVYEGNIIGTEEGSNIKIIIRSDFFILSLLAIFGAVAALGVYCLITGQSETGYGTVIAFIAFYCIQLIGFNYRTHKFKDLISRKLNSKIK